MEVKRNEHGNCYRYKIPLENTLPVCQLWKASFGNAWLPCPVYWSQRSQRWWHSSGSAAVWKDLGHSPSWWEFIVHLLIYPDSCWICPIFLDEGRCSRWRLNIKMLKNCCSPWLNHSPIRTCQANLYYYWKIFMWQNWKAVVWEYASFNKRSFFQVQQWKIKGERRHDPTP